MAAAAWLCWSLGGCALVGYDAVDPTTTDGPTRTLEGDVPNPGDGDTARAGDGDTARVGDGDTANVGEGDSGTLADAGTPVGDGDGPVVGTPWPGFDGGTPWPNPWDSGAFDGGGITLPNPAGNPACPGEENRCGGCTSLPAQPGDICGRCAVSRYVCEGLEAVRCDSPDEIPSANTLGVTVDRFDADDDVAEPESEITGHWTLERDTADGTLEPPAGSPILPNADGLLLGDSLRIQASGLTGQGAVLVLPMSAQGCAYDASAVDGVSFWSRGTGTAVLRLSTRATVSIANGGTCASACTGRYEFEFALGDSWNYRRVTWDALSAAGSGFPVALTPDALMSIEFLLPPGVPTDLNIDFIRFF